MNPERIMNLQTKRLKLIPLSYNQLLKYADLDYSLESELKLIPHEREMNDDFRKTIKSYLLPYISDNPGLLLFATVWVIVSREQNKAVGDIGFNAGPTDKGVIEVGYSTYPNSMNKGYMTEALGSICAWAFDQTGVNIIIAQTDRGNLATHKVLTKNNFIPFAEADNLYWWRLDKDDQAI